MPLRAASVHPLVTHAIARLNDDVSVAELVAETGYSHRTFLARFRDAAGLAPKTFARVLRSQRAAALLGARRPLAEVALTAGYSDQAHFTREFAAITGLPPSRFRALSPDAGNHVRV